ncbi:MAG: hypothetical protein R6W76_14180 [Caldilinea sp.]
MNQKPNDPEPMAQVVIENPVLDSPYVEPKQHFRFDDHGISDAIVGGRRRSSYFVPIARPRKKGARLCGHHQHNAAAARLHWTDPAREKRFFFCQIEALETAIYLTEVLRASRTRRSRTPCASPTKALTPASTVLRPRWRPESARRWS